jgi:hypothetical protein
MPREMYNPELEEFVQEYPDYEKGLHADNSTRHTTDKARCEHITCIWCFPKRLIKWYLKGRIAPSKMRHVQPNRNAGRPA